MPKRKVREAPPAPRAKPRDRKRVATDSAGSNGPQHSVNLVDLSGPQHSANLVDFPTSPNLNRETMSTQKQPPALNREQLDEVTRAVIAAMSCRAETSHPQNEMTQDASAEYPGTDILPTLAISNNQKSHVQSYHNDLGHNVSNKLKLKIANGEYVNLGLLVDRTNESLLMTIQNTSLCKVATLPCHPNTNPRLLQIFRYGLMHFWSMPLYMS